MMFQDFNGYPVWKVVINGKPVINQLIIVYNQGDYNVQGNNGIILVPAADKLIGVKKN
jgi:hypothetical protein